MRHSYTVPTHLLSSFNDSLTAQTYGDPSSAKFGRARDRFLESLAGYSIISYLLQIKDRHNGNILLSSDGRIIRK